MRISFRRWMLLLCAGLLLMGNAHFSFADEKTLVEARFTERETYSRMIDVPGKGKMRYYAQNDPLWEDLCYERSGSGKRRPFRDSGCSPASAAMAVASLIPESDLCSIAAFGKREYSLCDCSLNATRCIHNHTRYILSSQVDYVRFLPLVFGDFATGNNIFGMYSRTAAQGTGSNYLTGIAQAYGLSLRVSESLTEAYEAMDQGCAVIGLASQGGAFTNTGHFLLMAHRDEEMLYILDPLYRLEYKTNGAKKLQILEPGLVAMRYEDVQAALFRTFYILQPETTGETE
ncbi:MAG: hypothetical protein E7324_01705 [Clostridiales bacterium]|nr:hypothetical protein [Clostridiales bacterium]